MSSSRGVYMTPSTAQSSSFLSVQRILLVTVALLVLVVTFMITSGSWMINVSPPPPAPPIQQDLYKKPKSDGVESSSSDDDTKNSRDADNKNSKNTNLLLQQPPPSPPTMIILNAGQETPAGGGKGTEAEDTNNDDNNSIDFPKVHSFTDHNGDKDAVVVEIVRTPETDTRLIQLNRPYHKLRASIRKKMKTNPFRVHTFFTMDCTDHSIWQAGTLEYSWEKIGQEGLLSRIISGCESAKKEKVERTKRHFLSSDEVAEKRRGSFYAPYASTLPSGRHYAPFNRPHSVYYWLKHADLTEEVFVMLDPDMVFFNTLPTESVRLGKPMSQVYDYMEWTDFENFKCEHCPKFRFDRRPYAVGPPWMMHLNDWARVTPRWIQLTQELAEKYPSNWIAEMIAYSLACKVENLPHSLTYSAMVDNTDDSGVWNDLTDTLSVGSASEKRSSSNSGGATLPSTLHYCYTLEVGEMAPSEESKFAQHQRMVTRDEDPLANQPVLDWFHFSKYRVPTDWPGGRASYGLNFMECSAPLLQEFHAKSYMLRRAFRKSGNGVNNRRSSRHGGGGAGEAPPPEKMKSVWKRASQMLELLLPKINDAMTVYKKRYCDPKDMNLDKLLRTSHPTFFVSKWLIDEWDEEGASIKFHRKP